MNFFKETKNSSNEEKFIGLLSMLAHEVASGVPVLISPKWDDTAAKPVFLRCTKTYKTASSPSEWSREAKLSERLSPVPLSARSSLSVLPSIDSTDRKGRLVV